MRDGPPRLDVRVIVTLPSGQRKELGYAFAEETFRNVFIPLPRMRELDQFSMMEAQAQRERRERAAEAISRSLADAILRAVEETDTENGYAKSRP